nr:MFS transporter [Sphingomonas glacialis]
MLWLAVCYGAYSACYLAHLSWGATLSSDYAGRSRIFAWWQAGVLVGMIAVLATPVIVEGALHYDHQTRVAAMPWLVAALLPLRVLIAVSTVREPIGDRPHVPPRWIDYLRLMLQPTIARLLIADLVIGTAMGMNSALFFFYFGMVKHVPLLDITILLFLNLCGSLCCTPIWNYLTGRIGKHRAAAVAFILNAVSLLVIAVMPADRVIGGIVLFLVGLTLSAGPLLLRSMMADAGDEEYLRSGYDRTGLISALFAGTNKLGLALAPGITFLGLGFTHFDPVGRNGSAALATLTAFYIGVPATLGVITAALIVGHRLTAARHAAICAELAAKKQPH